MTALFASAVGSHAGLSPAVAVAQNGFAGPVGANVRVRPLDTDLESGSAGLHRVRCAVAAATTACYAAR